MTVGGAQRMLQLWDRYCGDRWDAAHLVCPPGGQAFPLRHTHVHQVAGRRAMDVIRRLQPDRLVHHGAFDGFGHYADCPVIWQMHGLPPLAQPAPVWTEPICIVANSDTTQIHLSWRKLPWRIIPPGVELDRYRVKEHTDHRPLVCGFVGRWHADKLPQSFLHHVVRYGLPPDWRLRLIGGGWQGPYVFSVRRQLKACQQVELAGETPPDKMPEVYQQLDALIVPTDPRIGETCCYAALEATASGLPVIARDLPGLRDTCGQAALYGLGDSDLVSLLQHLTPLDRRQELGRLARQQAEARGDARQHAEQLDCIYRLDADKRPPMVSILMAVRDTPARMLQEAWQSILDQTVQGWELVLVDDGSRNPETLALLDRIAQDKRVRLIRQEPLGLSAALNRGLQEASCELVARMDADDIMRPDRQEKQLQYMYDHQDVDILGAQIEIFEDQTGRVVGRTHHPKNVQWANVQQELRKRRLPWVTNHPTVMYRRSKILALGGYDETLTYTEDADLWLRALAGGLRLDNLPEVLLRYRRHRGQQTQRPEHRNEVQRILAKW